jgi:hypothetical protein
MQINPSCRLIHTINHTTMSIHYEEEEEEDDKEKEKDTITLPMIQQPMIPDINSNVPTTTPIVTSNSFFKILYYKIRSFFNL